ALTRASGVDGAQATRTAHFEALRAGIRVSLMRRELVARWERQMTALGAAGADQLGDEPERICAQFLPQLEDALAWYPQLLKPAIESLKTMGFNWERLLREVAPPLEAVGELRRLERAVRQLLQPVGRARRAPPPGARNEARPPPPQAPPAEEPPHHDG